MIKRILIIFLVITGIYIIFTNFPVLNWLGFNNSNNRSVAVTDQIDSIELQTTSVPTIIIPEDRDDIHIDYTGKGTVDLDQKGDSIEIEVKGPRFNFFSINRNAELKIYIPENYHRGMDLTVGSGSLEFSGATAKETMKLDELALNIGSGKMELSDLIVNELELQGSSGKIELDSIQVTQSDFHLSSGKLNISHYTGPIDAEISSGEMNIQIDELNGHSSLKASSGRINLDLPDDADFTLRGKIGSGMINSEFDLTNENSSKKELKGQHGSGAYNLDLEVSSGLIKLY